MQPRPDVTYHITGGTTLRGISIVPGAKNAALPAIAAALLATKGETVLHNVPMIDDVEAALDIATALGAQVQTYQSQGIVVIDASRLTTGRIPANLSQRIRGSVLFLPPLLHRIGEAVLEGLGGCDLGKRNLDFHYRGFARLGAHVDEDEETITIQAKRLTGAQLYLDTPSHTGTENLLAAAVLADGSTTIENASVEPEVVDFIRFLRAMGARISGEGTSTLVVEGINELVAVEHVLIPDRMDAGAFIMAVAATGGAVSLVGARLHDLGLARHKLEQMGVELRAEGPVLHANAPRPLLPTNIVTWPHPGFPTDLQPPLMALACFATGTSYFRETIFDGRFKVANELAKLGAAVTVDQSAAVVIGGQPLHGADVVAPDLRAGMALVIAALGVEGTTTIRSGGMIDRGYANIADRLTALGAIVERHSEEPLAA